MKFNSLEFTERLEHLTDVIRSQGEVEGSNVESVRVIPVEGSVLSAPAKTSCRERMGFQVRRTYPPFMGPLAPGPPPTPFALSRA
jgi:hypothetical protein